MSENILNEENRQRTGHYWLLNLDAALEGEKLYQIASGGIVRPKCVRFENGEWINIEKDETQMEIMPMCPTRRTGEEETRRTLPVLYGTSSTLSLRPAEPSTA